MVTLAPRRVLVAVILLLGVASACGRPPVTLPSPDALSRQVTIRRDTFGIPHILAETEEAAAFAFGYAQAEDHAEVIARNLVAARGEEAKYFGEPGLQNDLAMAQFDNLAEARRGLDRVSPLYRRMLAAYAAGVNRYVSRHKDTLPAWIPEFTAADILANSRSGAAESLGGPGLIRQLRNKYEGGPARGVEPDDAWIDAPGSNALALGGSRTTTGKPILLGNPHLSWSSLYWEAHVRVPGRIDFYGSTLAGIPILRAGFNDRLGFVQTNNAPDLDDVFALEMDPAHADHYLFDGRSWPLEQYAVSVPVGNADGSSRVETRSFWRSRIGPIVFRTPERAFAIKSIRLDAYRYYEGFYELSKTRTLDQWLATLRLNYVPTSNFTYADADGNILYQWNARLPVRRQGVDYSLDVDARSARDLWSTLHAVADFPRKLNPPGGYIQNANNPPQFVSIRDPIDMSRYPSYFERGALALRPQLAIDMLESRPAFAVADVIALKYNTRLLLAERVKGAVVEAVRSAPDAPEEARAGADVLDAWDGHSSSDSRGTALFLRFWDSYAGAVRSPFAAAWDAANPARTPSGISDRAAAVTHLASAVRAMRNAYGSERVAWGDVNRFRAGSLDLPGDGASGTYGAYRVVRFDTVPGETARIAGNTAEGRPLSGFGDAWVLLVDFSAPATAWSVLAYGQSSHLDSPHSRDQLPIYAAHQLRRAWYSEADIKAHLEREYHP